MDVFFSIFIGICALVAVIDFLIYKIPNELLAFMFLLFFVKVFFMQGLSIETLQWPLIIFSATLVGCFILYTLKGLGAGDAKLIAVASLWLSDINILLFFLMMAAAGGVMGFVYLKGHQFIDMFRVFLLGKIRSVPAMAGYFVEQDSPMLRKQKGENAKIIPYGIAVFVGILLTLQFY